jgi:hypothetical protein
MNMKYKCDDNGCYWLYRDSWAVQVVQMSAKRFAGITFEKDYKPCSSSLGWLGGQLRLQADITNIFWGSNQYKTKKNSSGYLSFLGRTHIAHAVKLRLAGEYPLHCQVIALPFACAGSFFDLSFFDFSFYIFAPGGVTILVSLPAQVTITFPWCFVVCWQRKFWTWSLTFFSFITCNEIHSLAESLPPSASQRMPRKLRHDTFCVFCDNISMTLSFFLIPGPCLAVQFSCAVWMPGSPHG